MKQLVKIAGLKGLRNFIKDHCESHQAVSQFRSGVNLLEDNSENQYPLAFLESDFSSNVEGTSETYDINLNIADYIGSNPDEDQIIDGLSKTEQILSEIHYAISQAGTNIKVSGMNKLSFRDYDTDSLVVTRGEFTITIARHTARA